MKNPFEQRLELHYSVLEKTQQNFIFNFTQMDKILVWIVGFNVTGIGIIVSKVSSLSTVYGNSLLKTILILLTISIISGLNYRISALFYLTVYQKILFYLEGAFSNQTSMPTENKEFKSPNDINEVYQSIKSDFDFDYFDILERYRESQNEKEKTVFVTYLKSEYARLAEWSKYQNEYANTYVRQVLKESLGMSEKQLDKLSKKQNDALQLKFWGINCLVAISICLVCFLSVIMLLVINYR